MSDKMQYTLSNYIVKKCINFAEERASTSFSFYRYRGKSSKEKIEQDILIGCLGEWGVYYFLRELGYNVQKPDMKLLETGKKSYDADFYCKNSGINFHCKSQSTDSVKRYGPSWLVQRKDPVIKNPCASDWFIFCEVEGNCVTVMGCVNSTNLKFGECEVPWFRNTKLAIYLEQQNLEEL